MRPTVVAIAALLACQQLAFAQSMAAPDDSVVRLTDRFLEEETLYFDAKFGLLKVGGAWMRALGADSVRGEPTLHFQFLLQGGPFFYRLNDRMDSWVGLDDFTSRRFTKDFDEGGKQWTEAYEIFPDSGFYRVPDVDTVIPASPDPLDDVAFFYFVRSLELEPGQRYEFANYFRPDRNPVIIEVLARDTVDVPAGRFPSVVIQPIIQGRGIFAENKNARMWISDDDRRLIVQMKSKFPFGTVTLRLKEIETTSGTASPRP